MLQLDIALSININQCHTFFGYNVEQSNQSASYHSIHELSLRLYVQKRASTFITVQLKFKLQFVQIGSCVLRLILYSGISCTNMQLSPPHLCRPSLQSTVTHAARRRVASV